MKEYEQVNQYRLHHWPFLLMWVASFGVAWLGVFFGGLLLNDLRYRLDYFREISWWIDSNPWFYGLLTGAGIGAFLALVQPWLMRWRYGFVPRFWRIMTFLGASLGGSFSFAYVFGGYGGYYDNAFSVWDYMARSAPWFIWFSSLSFAQMLALWPVARRAWLYSLAGLGATGLGFLLGLVDSYSMGQLNTLFFGSFAQAVFSGALFLYLMRDYRVEAVQKRDEKAKAVLRRGLHPISFIGLWMMAHLFGWVALLSVVFMLTIASFSFGFVQNFMNWLGSFEWPFAIALGLIVGSMTAIGQPWLMQQQSGYRPRFWMPLSLFAWAVAGLGLWQFMDNYNAGDVWRGMMLVLWFGFPTIFQSVALWTYSRTAWLYGLAGLVSGVVAYLFYQQFDWSSGNSGYAIIFGAIAQAILTGVVFLFIIQTQPKEAENPDVFPQE
jgi:hypothetical protein